jgi:hypothetical protein
MNIDDRVLILYSWNDDVTERRFEAMHESPMLEGIVFEHCLALKSEEEVINSSVLVGRVSKYIEFFEPSIFLLHTGAAFHQHREMFLNALPLLKQLHKNLRFGYERRFWERSDDLVSTGVFDDSPEIREVEELFFERVFLR